MKRLFILGLIIVLLLPSITRAGNKEETRDILIGVMDHIGGEYEGEEINLGQTINFQYLPIDKLEEIGDNIRDLLEIQGDGILLVEDRLNHLTIYGYDKDENFFTIILSSFLNQETSQGETYLFINLEKREKKSNINGIIKKMEKIFKDFDTKGRINILVSGSLEGKLDNREINQIIENTKNRTKGKIVETYKDRILESHTLYTSLIDQYIFTMEKKINLNLVIRYNEDEDKTHIILGTPIITTGY